MNREPHYPDNEEEKTARTITTLVYALQATSVLLGTLIFLLLGTPLAFILAFIIAIIAIVINFGKRADTRGTRIESHAHWQIKTFWFVILLTVLSVIASPLGADRFIFTATIIWAIYRIAKGWIRLSHGKEMYGSGS